MENTAGQWVFLMAALPVGCRAGGEPRVPPLVHGLSSGSGCDKATRFLCSASEMYMSAAAKWKQPTFQRGKMLKEVLGRKVKENTIQQHSKSRTDLENKKEILLG